MACGKCGSGGGTSASLVTDPTNNGSEDLVLMEYIGIPTQKQRRTSKANPREKYTFSGEERRFYANPRDVEWLTAMSNTFRVVEQPKVQRLAAVDVPTLESAMRTVQSDLPLDVLTLDPIIIGLLKRRFATVSELRNAGYAEWLTIKGIGSARADDIQEALNALR